MLAYREKKKNEKKKNEKKFKPAPTLVRRAKATLHVGASYTNAYDLTCGYQNSNLYSTNIVKELSPPPPPGPYSLDVQKLRRTVFPRELGPGGGGGGGIALYAN